MLDGAGSGGHHQSPRPSPRTGLAERPYGPAATAGLCPHGRSVTHPSAPQTKRGLTPFPRAMTVLGGLGHRVHPRSPFRRSFCPGRARLCRSNGGGESPRPPPGHRLPEHFPCGRGPDRGWPRPPQGLPRGAAWAAWHGARYSRRWSPALMTRAQPNKISERSL